MITGFCLACVLVLVENLRPQGIWRRCVAEDSAHPHVLGSIQKRPAPLPKFIHQPDVLTQASREHRGKITTRLLLLHSGMREAMRRLDIYRLAICFTKRSAVTNTRPNELER